MYTVIIEEDPELRYLWVHAFEQANLTVVTLANSAEAYPIISAHGPPLALIVDSDPTHPTVRDLLLTTRAQPGGNDTYVLFITHDHLQDLRAVRPYIDEHLVKPVSYRHLRQRARELSSGPSESKAPA